MDSGPRSTDYGRVVVCCSRLTSADLGFQNENKCKLRYVDGAFRKSQPSYIVGKPVVKKQSVAAAVKWFNGREAEASAGHPVSPLTRLNSTMIKPDSSYESTSSNDDNNMLDPTGLPSAEQLEYVFNRLAENVSILQVSSSA